MSETNYFSAQSLNNRVAHNMDNLVTVVDQTKHELRRNRQHILDIEYYLTQLKEEIDIIIQNSDQLEDCIAKLELGAWIESTLSTTEATHQRWLRYQDQYIAQ